MVKVKIILGAILLGLFTVIVTQNTDPMSIKLFMWEPTMSRIILLLLTMLIGFILGFISAKLTEIRSKMSKSGDAKKLDF